MHGEFTEFIIHTALFEQAAEQSYLRVGRSRECFAASEEDGGDGKSGRILQARVLVLGEYQAAYMEYLLSYEARLLLDAFVLRFC